MPLYNDSTFLGLQTLVLGHSFNESRYRGYARYYLNDAALEVSRLLGLGRASGVYAYAVADGAVDFGDDTFIRFEQVWTADTPATVPERGDDAVRRLACDVLSPLPMASVAEMGDGEPEFYFARNVLTSSGLGSGYGLGLFVTPPGDGGYVAVTGLLAPAVMSDDSDLSPLGRECDRALVAYAKARLFEIQDDAQMAQHWDGAFASALGVASRPAVMDGPRVTPGTWDEVTIADHGR